MDARIAMERGVARILLATTTRRGSKLTPLDRIAIETLGMKTGEARRVDLAAARTGARGRMLTDEDARDIIAGRACSCVRVRRHAVVGALHSGRAYRPACQQISERRYFEAAGNNRHLHIVRAGDRRTPYARWSHRRNPRGRGRGKETLPSLPGRTRTSRTAASTTSATRISPSGCAGAAKKIRAMQSRTALASAFFDSKIDIGPNKDGVLMETKGGRMMLQRSLCRPKFSSQVRSPRTSQKNKQDLTTGAPAHDPRTQRKVAEALEMGYGLSRDDRWVPWWTEKDADLKYGDLSGPSHTNLGGGLPVGITTRFVHDDFNHDDFHWHPEFTPFHTAELRQIETHGVVAAACFPLLTVTLHKWLTGFNTKTPEEALRAAAAAAAANHKPPRPSQSQSQWPGPSLATSPEHTPARRPSANDLRGPSGSFQKERNIRRVLYLVTGFGDPVEESHSPEANSTAATARLMKRFINACHPHVEVKLVDSGAGVFRYDENVRFLQTNLRPALERERDSVARRWGEEWPRRFKLTMALCGGAPARLQALTAAFRDMQPYLLHVWRLKTFWHQGLLRKDDVDMQKWETGGGRAADAIDPGRSPIVLRARRLELTRTHGRGRGCEFSHGDGPGDEEAPRRVPLDVARRTRTRRVLAKKNSKAGARRALRPAT